MPRFNPTSKKEAVRLARELLKKIKFPGFKIDVWENLGWHYRVKSDFFAVDEDHRGSTSEVYYTAVMNSTGNGSGSHHSGYFNTGVARAADPNEAIEKCIKDAYKVHMEIGEVLGKICESIKVEPRFYIGIEIPADKCGNFVVGTEK